MCVQTEEADAKATNKLEGTEKTVAPGESFGNEGEDDHDHGHKMRHGLGWGKGIVADVKRTLLTHWKAEMTNLNGKVSLPSSNSFSESHFHVEFFLTPYYPRVGYRN